MSPAPAGIRQGMSGPEDSEGAGRARDTDEDRAARERRARSPLHPADAPDALRPDLPQPVPPENPQAHRDPEDESDPVEGPPH